MIIPLKAGTCTVITWCITRPCSKTTLITSILSVTLHVWYPSWIGIGIWKDFMTEWLWNFTTLIRTVFHECSRSLIAFCKGFVVFDHHKESRAFITCVYKKLRSFILFKLMSCLFVKFHKCSRKLKGSICQFLLILLEVHGLIGQGGVTTHSELQCNPSAARCTLQCTAAIHFSVQCISRTVKDMLRCTDSILKRCQNGAHLLKSSRGPKKAHFKWLTYFGLPTELGGFWRIYNIIFFSWDVRIVKHEIP